MTAATPGDYTDIRKFSKDVGFGKTREFATITVHTEQEGAQMPSLPFLHRGDVFRDSDGNDWEITRAVQDAQYHRRAHVEGGFQETFSWEYTAVLKEEEPPSREAQGASFAPGGDY